MTWRDLFVWPPAIYGALLVGAAIASPWPWRIVPAVFAAQGFLLSWLLNRILPRSGS